AGPDQGAGAHPRHPRRYRRTRRLHHQRHVQPHLAAALPGESAGTRGVASPWRTHVIRVRAGIFSLTPATPPDDDGSYLRWHLLDHMPEQYQLPGIVHGLRWSAAGEYLDHRIAAHGPLRL